MDSKIESNQLGPDYDMYDRILPAFAVHMKKELAANFKKGDRVGEKGWLNVNSNKFWISELYYHVGKLQSALMIVDDSERERRIKENTADVANLAMMLLDSHIHLIDIRPHAMPMYDGDYLCKLDIQQPCGTVHTKWKVVTCSKNEWVISENENVLLWQNLPS